MKAGIERLQVWGSDILYMCFLSLHCHSRIHVLHYNRHGRINKDAPEVLTAGENGIMANKHDCLLMSQE